MLSELEVHFLNRAVKSIGRFNLLISRSYFDSSFGYLSFRSMVPRLRFSALKLLVLSRHLFPPIASASISASPFLAHPAY